MANRLNHLFRYAQSGILSIATTLRKGEYDSQGAKKIWGFSSPILFLAGVLCVVISALLPMGVRNADPFAMSFPYQSPGIVMGLACSPLVLFALFCGWRIRKAIEAKHLTSSNFEINRANLCRPVFIAGTVVLMMTQVVMSLPAFEKGFTYSILIHSLGNLMFLCAWLTFFLSVSVMNTGLGFGKILAGFFSYHAVLFARSFVPDFGILDFIVANILSLNYSGSVLKSLISSCLKAILACGVTGIIWAIFQEKLLDKLQTVPIDKIKTQPISSKPPLPPLPK